MAIFRLLSLTMITVLVLGMLNYILLDKLSYMYISVVIGLVSIVFICCNKLCLSYLNAKEVTSNIDSELINLAKSLTFSRSLKTPRIYRFNSSEKSMLVLKSALGWDIAISSNTLDKITFEQKKAIIKTAIKIKETDSLYLKTFGLCLKVIILNVTDNKFMRLEIIKKVSFIFLRPIFIFINFMSMTKLKINIDRSLLEFKKTENIDLNLFEKIFLTDSNYDLSQKYNIFENSDSSYE